MSFDKVIEQPMILVDFWAEWCAPCKVLDPVLSGLAAELNGEVLVGKVNVDENRILANRFGISSIPTIILFKQGKEVHRFTGVQSKEMLMIYIQKHKI